MANKRGPNGAEELRVSNGTVPDFGFSEGQEALHEGNLTVAEEAHIPDYVMLDFGSPKERVPTESCPPDGTG